MKIKPIHKNEPVSAIIHIFGILLGIAGLVLMVVFASIKATVWHVVGFSIFGASMILLYIASVLYHFIPKARNVFLKIDHSMIYVLIAGTYTPICFVALKGAWGWSMFGVIWGLAVLGIVLKSVFLNKINDIYSTALYVLMGWLLVVAFLPLVNSIPIQGILWLVGGGISYTVGAIFYGLNRKWFHEIFHIFVIIGSFCHFWLMLAYILYI